jgi:hypothetical protein
MNHFDGGCTCGAGDPRLRKVRQRGSLLKGLIGRPGPGSALAPATDESLSAKGYLNTGGAIEREHRQPVRNWWGPGDEWFDFDDGSVGHG